MPAEQTNTNSVRQILGKPPVWIVRWGIAAIALALSSLFVAAFFIQIPELVYAHAQLSAQAVPVTIRISPKVDHFRILVNDGDTVEVNDMLMAEKTRLDINWLNQLEKKLSDWRTAEEIQHYIDWYEANKIETQEWQTELYEIELLANAYANSLSGSSNLSTSKANRLQREAASKKIKIIERAISDARYKQKRILDNIRNAQKQAKLPANYQQLLWQRDQVNSRIDDLNFDLQLANEEYSRIGQWVKSLELSADSEAQRKFFDLRNKNNQLLKQIQEWKKEHLLLSPISGVVRYKQQLRKNRVYKHNGQKFEPVMSIEPENTKNSDSYSGVIRLERKQAVRIRENQLLSLQIDGYTDDPNKRISGRITSQPYVSDAEPDVLLVDFKLTDSLQVSPEAISPIDNILRAKVSITVDRKRLLAKLFPVLSAA